MKDISEVYIYDTIRTPRGRGTAKGALFEVHPIDLITTLLNSVKSRNELLSLSKLSELILGCVTPINDQGYNIAKAALMYAQWPDTISGMQINKYCASGLEAVNMAATKIMANQTELVLAGGVESMSRVPMWSDGGALLHQPKVINKAKHIPQGLAADLIATLNNYTSEQLNKYALFSQQRAATAIRNNYFKNSIIPITDQNNISILNEDETPRPNTSLKNLESLQPVFESYSKIGYEKIAKIKYPQVANLNHLHTAGNSSSYADGAALILLGNKTIEESFGLHPKARIVAIGNTSTEPTIMLTGAVQATNAALQQAQLNVEDIDLWEVNEAFAAVVLFFSDTLNIDINKINVNGGAIALGHPLGATGSIILGTLLEELQRQNLKYGLATLCAGGGMGVATIIQNLEV